MGIQLLFPIKISYYKENSTTEESAADSLVRIKCKNKKVEEIVHRVKFFFYMLLSLVSSQKPHRVLQAPLRVMSEFRARSKPDHSHLSLKDTKHPLN